MAEALPLFEHLVQGLKERVDLGSPEGRGRLLELAGPLFAQLRDPKSRDFLVQRLDAIVKLGEKQVLRHLERSKTRNRESNHNEAAENVRRSWELLRRQPVTRQALQLFLADPHGLAEDVLGVAEDLRRNRSAGIHLLLTAAETVHAHPELKVGVLVERLRAEPYGEALAQLAGSDPGVPPEGRKSQFQGCLRKLQAHAIRSRLDALEEEFRAPSLSAEQVQRLQAEQKDLKLQLEQMERVGAPRQGQPPT